MNLVRLTPYAPLVGPLLLLLMSMLQMVATWLFSLLLTLISTRQSFAAHSIRLLLGVTCGPSIGAHTVGLLLSYLLVSLWARGLGVLALLP